MKKDREETQQTGSIGLAPYIGFFTAGWGFLGPIVVIVFFLIAQGLVVAADYWLSKW
jgi:uncharacterized membrane protein